MFNLIGYRTDHEYGYGGWTGMTTDVTEVVATFDDKKSALRYIKNSKLKNPRDSDKPFKQSSLLANFQGAGVEEEEIPQSFPHNPEISVLPLVHKAAYLGSRESLCGRYIDALVHPIRSERRWFDVTCPACLKHKPTRR